MRSLTRQYWASQVITPVTRSLSLCLHQFLFQVNLSSWMSRLQEQRGKKHDALIWPWGHDGHQPGTKTEQKRTMSILQWSLAGNRFVTVLTEQQPILAPKLGADMELIMELIMKLAHGADNEAGTKKGKTAVLWSRVRKLIERGEASRESTHLDLYLQAMIPDVSNRLSSPVSYTFRRAQFSGNKPEHKIPSGACYAYHSMRYYREGAKMHMQAQVLQQWLLRQPFSGKMGTIHAAAPTTSCQPFLEDNALSTAPCLPLQHSPAEAAPFGQQPLGQQVHSPFWPAGVRTGHPNHINPSPDVLRISTDAPSSSNTLSKPVNVQCLSRWLQGYGQERAPLIGFTFGFDIGFQGKPKHL